MTRRQRAALRANPGRRFTVFQCGACPGATYDRVTRRWFPADTDLYLVAERLHGHRRACAMAAGFLPVPESYRKAAIEHRANVDRILAGRGRE